MAESWPTDGPDFNRWNKDLVGFVTMRAYVTSRTQIGPL